MTEKRFLIPKPMEHILGRLPAWPGTVMLVTALNLVLARYLTFDVTKLLNGKKLRLCVTDAHCAFNFEWRSHRFVACSEGGTADLTISACMQDFVLIALRKEDPDTLFFSRRLAMEGDTELGILVKNTLDAIELPVFHVEQFYPKAVLMQVCRGISEGWSHCKPR